MLARDKRKQAEQQSEHNRAEVLNIACLPYAGLQLAPASNVDPPVLVVQLTVGVRAPTQRLRQRDLIRFADRH